MIRLLIETMPKPLRAAPGPDVRQSIGWLTLVLAASLPIYRPWVGIAAVLVALVWSAGRGLRDRLTAVRGSRLATAAIALLALHLVSVAWSAHRWEGLREMGTTWYLLLVPILATALPRAFRRPAVAVFAATATVAAALSLSIAAAKWNIGRGHAGNPSPVMHHIDFSLMLAMASLMAAIQLLYGTGSHRGRWLWATSWLLTTGALFVNIGRSGHLAFVIGLLVLAAHWSRGRSVKATAAVAVAAAVVLATVWLASPRLRERSATAGTELAAAVAGDTYDSSVGGRVAATKVALELMAQRPFLGTGVGGAVPAFRERLRAHRPEMEFAVSWYPHLHSQYLQTAVELGLAGFLALGWVFWELVQVRPGRPEFGAAAVVTAAVFLVGFIAEPFFSKPMTLAVFSLFAGIVAAERAG